MINQQRLLNTFLSLVKISSTTGFESEVAGWVSAYLDNLKILYFHDSVGNIIARLPGSGQPLLLTAHMDTVEPGRGIKPQINQGNITSSGDTILGADNKVGLAVILETLAVLSQTSLPHQELEIIFTVSEESGNVGAVGADLDGILSTYGFSFDSGGEIGTVITASPFYTRFDIDLSGPSAHASKPESAENVFNIMRHVLEQLVFGWQNPDTLMNIGKISGGSVRNSIPGDLHLQGEIRSFNSADLDRVTDRVESVFKSAVSATKTRLNFSAVLENPGFSLSADSPGLIRAEKVLSSKGRKANFIRTFACFDANIFNSRGIHIVNLSDGSKNNHTVTESMAIRDLNLLADICLGLSSSV